MTAPRPELVSKPKIIERTGPLTCPSCGHEFIARWLGDRKTGLQRCPSCVQVFEATWPGFTFAPETVIIGPSGRSPVVASPDSFDADLSELHTHVDNLARTLGGLPRSR